MTLEAQPATGLAVRPEATLESIAQQSKPVQFEIEKTQIRFRSRITLKDGQVIVVRPPGLNGMLTAKSSVRVRLPDRPGEEVRLKVVVPHADVGTGSEVFICAAPDAPIKNRRAADRYSVAHDDRLQLELKGEIFNLTDFSVRGLRIALSPSQIRLDLPIGHNLGSATLKFGADVWIRLEQLIPRYRQWNLIGFEFKIAKDEVSAQNTIALIDALKNTPISVTSSGRGRSLR
jgi:hypothetical protein